jgi:hypothetical protein
MRQDQTTPLDRRALLQRMAVGGAALWAAPTFHSVASAAAAPSCGPGLLDWDTFTTGSTFSSANVNGTTVTISGIANPGTTLFPTNRRVTAGPAGGVNQKYLRFEMVPNASGRFQTITIAFSNPVSLLSFRLFDIDTVEDAWRDEIYVLTPGFTHVIPAGSTVQQGGGGNTNRFRNNNNNNNVNENAGTGNLQLGHNGPITSFQIRYQNGNQSGGQNQWVGMSDISFLC